MRFAMLTPNSEVILEKFKFNVIQARKQRELLHHAWNNTDSYGSTTSSMNGEAVPMDDIHTTPTLQLASTEDTGSTMAPNRSYDPFENRTDASATLQLRTTEVTGSTMAPNKAYDPFENRKDASVTDAGALIHLIKSSLGTGVLAMPYAFRNAGLALGLVGTLVVGFVCTHCIHILVHTSHELCRRTRSPALSYAETGRVAFLTGPKRLRHLSNTVRLFLDGCLVVCYYSVGVVYVVFISTSTKQIGDHYAKTPETMFDVRLYMVFFIIPLCGLSLVRNLKYLAPFSALANLFIFVSFSITLMYIFTDLPSISQRETVASLQQFPLFYSTVIFALEGIGVVMPIENSMVEPAHFLGCPGILNSSMTIVVALYTTIGFFGYVKYGGNTRGSVILNLPIDEPLAQLVKILIAAAIFFTYGLQMYVPTLIVWDGLQNYVPENWQTAAERAYRIFVVILSVCVGVAVPTLGPIISLVGAVCFSTLGLLCPALIETVAFWEDGLGWRLYKNVVIVIFSLLALLAGSYSSILEIITVYS